MQVRAQRIGGELLFPQPGGELRDTCSRVLPHARNR
jgi:hypothetical protein